MANLYNINIEALTGNQIDIDALTTNKRKKILSLKNVSGMACRTPSVTSGLKIFFRPGKPALASGHLVNSNENFMFFLPTKFSRLGLLLFLI